MRSPEVVVHLCRRCSLAFISIHWHSSYLIGPRTLGAPSNMKTPATLIFSHLLTSSYIWISSVRKKPCDVLGECGSKIKKAVPLWLQTETHLVSRFAGHFIIQFDTACPTSQLLQVEEIVPSFCYVVPMHIWDHVGWIHRGWSNHWPAVHIWREQHIILSSSPLFRRMYSGKPAWQQKELP